MVQKNGNGFCRREAQKQLLLPNQEGSFDIQVRGKRRKNFDGNEIGVASSQMWKFREPALLHDFNNPNEHQIFVSNETVRLFCAEKRNYKSRGTNR